MDPSVSARVRWLLIAVCLVATAGFVTGRLLKHARAQLVPAYVAADDDARAMLQPSLRRQLAMLLADVRPRPVRPRLIALTFDDGPYPVESPLLVEQLRNLHVPATFLLIGHDAEQFPGLARAVAGGGDEVENHTYSHPDLDRLSPAGVQDELRGGADALASIGLHQSSIRMRMRPPHGRYTMATVLAAQHAGYAVVLWTDDPGDWRTLTPQAIVAHVVTRATAPEILLLHSGKLATVEALPEIVARFRAAGYRFVTVGELLRALPERALNDPQRRVLGG
ncbi:polysaccharide deacetylase family protein [bacterium]|nr:MAG: polysaccharide deacetylase family protein [bacterium]